MGCFTCEAVVFAELDVRTAKPLDAEPWPRASWLLTTSPEISSSPLMPGHSERDDHRICELDRAASSSGTAALRRRDRSRNARKIARFVQHCKLRRAPHRAGARRTGPGIRTAEKCSAALSNAYLVGARQVSLKPSTHRVACSVKSMVDRCRTTFARHR